MWALPAATHDSRTAYKFVRFLWRPEIHARECEALGMLPLHPDVVAERVSRFRLEWMSHVFEAGLAQLHNGEATPQSLIEKGIGSVYAQLWAKIVALTPPVAAAAIADVLKAPPTPKPWRSTAVADDKDEGSGSAAEPEAEAPPPEQEDWETDVVLEGVGSAGGHR